MIGNTWHGERGNNKDYEVDGFFSFLNNSDIEIILFGIYPLIKNDNLEFGEDSGRMVE